MHYREAAANLLTNPKLDPYAGIPELKVSAVRIEPVRRKIEAAEWEARSQATLVAGDD
jgi:formate dehydrogenase major subunit